MVSWTTVRFDHLAKWVIISTRRPAIIDPDVSDLLKRVELDPLLMDATRASLYRADEPLRFLKGLYSSDTNMSPYLYLKGFHADYRRSFLIRIGLVYYRL